jgi:G3E family GTPase
MHAVMIPTTPPALRMLVFQNMRMESLDCISKYVRIRAAIKIADAKQTESRSKTNEQRNVGNARVKSGNTTDTLVISKLLYGRAP